MPRIATKCVCGKVQGTTEDVSARTGTRLVCCCDDCQAFARHLGDDGTILDEYGGTDIFQTPVSGLRITSGAEELACVRLGPKGLYRWYAGCCNTPIGNTMGPGVPFLGLIHSFMDNAATRDADLGRSRGHIQTGAALQPVPEDLKPARLPLVLRSITKLLGWKLKGLDRPSPFFDEDGNPMVAPIVLEHRP